MKKSVHQGALTIIFFGEIFQVHPFNLLQQTTRHSFNAKYTRLVLTEKKKKKMDRYFWNSVDAKK